MNLFHQILRITGRIALVVGVFLSLFAALEVVRLFVFLYRIRPYMGWTYAVLVIALVVWAVLYIGGYLRRYPRPLKAPPRPDFGTPEHAELKVYATYLLTYQKRLLRNKRLPPELRDPLRDEIDTMEGLLGHHPLNEDLIRIIEKSEQHLLPPIHQSLKDQSEREIRHSVRDVMLGVTLSPYHSIDLLIVLYRNFSMIFRIISVYETTPSPRAQLRILRDVLRVMATVNFLYIGRNLVENLFAFVPWVGRVADDIGQGLGAGLFTSACGHAVIDRCASYDEWEKTAAVESLASQSKGFLRDVKHIFTKDVLPDIRNRIISEVPEGRTQEPGFWENLQKGVNNAFDATTKALGAMIPFASVAPATGPDIEAAEARPDPRYESSRPQSRPSPAHRHAQSFSAADAPHSRRRRKRHRRGVARVLHTFGQRVKYTLGLGRD